MNTCICLFTVTGTYTFMLVYTYTHIETSSASFGALCGSCHTLGTRHGLHQGLPRVVLAAWLHEGKASEKTAYCQGPNLSMGSYRLCIRSVAAACRMHGQITWVCRCFPKDCEGAAVERMGRGLLCRRCLNSKYPKHWPSAQKMSCLVHYFGQRRGINTYQVHVQVYDATAVLGICWSHNLVD